MVELTWRDPGWDILEEVGLELGTVVACRAET